MRTRGRERANRLHQRSHLVFECTRSHTRFCAVSLSFSLSLCVCALPCLQSAAAPTSGWKVLNEDYLMGGKMTDWDKAVNSSEEEEEDE